MLPIEQDTGFQTKHRETRIELTRQYKSQKHRWTCSLWLEFCFISKAQQSIINNKSRYQRVVSALFLIYAASGGAQTDPVWIALCKSPQTPVISFSSKLSASNLSLALCHNPSQTHYWLTCRSVSIRTLVLKLWRADNVQKDESQANRMWSPLKRCCAIVCLSCILMRPNPGPLIREITEILHNTNKLLPELGLLSSLRHCRHMTRVTRVSHVLSSPLKFLLPFSAFWCYMSTLFSKHHQTIHVKIWKLWVTVIISYAGTDHKELPIWANSKMNTGEQLQLHFYVNNRSLHQEGFKQIKWVSSIVTV